MIPVIHLPFANMSLASTVAMALFRRDKRPNLEDCTIATCDIHDSWYQYRPSLAANTTLTVLFAISLSAFVTQGILSKRFIGFSIAMAFGTFGEALGYAARIMMYNNPWQRVRTEKP